MSPHDVLRDRLADAAGSVRPSVPVGPEVRRSAVRHRTQRRVLGGSAVVVSLVAVAVAGSTLLAPRTSSTGPATPSPSVTAFPDESVAPEPTASTSPDPTTSTPSSTEPAGPPPLTQAAAQEVVEQLRFPQEAAWSTGAYGVGPLEVETVVTRWVAASCADDAAMVPDALAMRTVTLPDAEGAGVRQIAVFADAATAAAAFGRLREQIRACVAGTVPFDSGGSTTSSLVGEQLDLGDEAFWHGVVVVVTTGDGSRYESFSSFAEVLVLDRNVVTIFPAYPAISDDMRTEHVEQSTADWADVIRPQYEAVLR